MPSPPPGGELVWLWLLSGWVAADQTAALQLMVGQPLVCGWLAGIIVAQPALGLFLGASLQLLWSRVAPVGATAYPDGGPATVAGVAIAAFTARGLTVWTPASGSPFPGGPHAMAVLAGLAAALVVGRAGQALTVRERRGNARLAEAADRAAAKGSWAGVERANLTGMARAAARGLLLFPAALGVFALSAVAVRVHLPRVAFVEWPAFNPGIHLFWSIGLAAVLTVLWRGTRKDWVALGIGLVIAIVLGRL
jgi:PTS system mannose-specific IIC component